MSAELIKAARRKLGETQAEFGARLGFTGDPGRTVRRWERGERTPGPLVIDACRKIMGRERARHD